MDDRRVMPERGHSEFSTMSVRNMGAVEGRRTVIDYFNESVDEDEAPSSNDDFDPELDERSKFIQNQLQALSGVAPELSRGTKVDFSGPNMQGQQYPYEQTLQSNVGGLTSSSVNVRDGGACGAPAEAVSSSNEDVHLSDWDKKEAEPPGSSWLDDSSTTATTVNAGEKNNAQSVSPHVNADLKSKVDVQQTLYNEIIRMLRFEAKNRPHKGLRCGVEICKTVSKQGKHVMPTLNMATQAGGFRRGLIGWLELMSKLKGEIIVQRNDKGGTVWFMTDVPENIKRKALNTNKKGKSSTPSDDSSGHEETDSDVDSTYKEAVGISNLLLLDRNHERYDNGEHGEGTMSHGSTRGLEEGYDDTSQHLDRKSSPYIGGNGNGKGSDSDRFRCSSRSQGRGERSSSVPHRRHSNDVSSYGDRDRQRSNEYWDREVYKVSNYAALVDHGVTGRHRSSNSRDRRASFGSQSDFCGGDRDRRRSSSGGKQDRDYWDGKSRNDFGEGSSGEHRRYGHSFNRGSNTGRNYDNGNHRDSRDWDREKPHHRQQHNETHAGGTGASRDNRGQQSQKLETVKGESNSSSSNTSTLVDPISASRKDLIPPPPDSPPPPERVVSLTSHDLSPSETTFSDVCHDEVEYLGVKKPQELHQRREEMKEQQKDVTMAETWSEHQQRPQEEQVMSRKAVEVYDDFENQQQPLELQTQRPEVRNKEEKPTVTKMAIGEKHKQLLENESITKTIPKTTEKPLQPQQQKLQKQATNVAEEDENKHQDQLQTEQHSGSDDGTSSDSSICNFYTSDEDIVISACSRASRRTEIGIGTTLPSKGGAAEFSSSGNSGVSSYLKKGKKSTTFSKKRGTGSKSSKASTKELQNEKHNGCSVGGMQSHSELVDDHCVDDNTGDAKLVVAVEFSGDGATDKTGSKPRAASIGSDESHTSSDLHYDINDDRPCDACSYPDPRYQNGGLDDIVYCDTCNVPVHQQCYRLSEIPPGEWFCDVCVSNVDPDEVTCGFCPVIGGAMKRCKGNEEEGWAHLSCAYFIDELDIETIDEVDYIGVDPAHVNVSDGGSGSAATRTSNRKGVWKGKDRNNSTALLTRTCGLHDYPFSTQKCAVCKLDLQG